MMLQYALERKVTEALGRSYYENAPATTKEKGRRNGYESVVDLRNQIALASEEDYAVLAHARSFQRSEVMPGSPSYQPVSRWQIWTMTPSSLDDGQTGPSGDTPPRSCHVRGSGPESAPGP